MHALIIAAALMSAPALGQTELPRAAPTFVIPIQETVGEQVTRVTAAQNGESVDVTQGGKLVIVLSVNPSTGAHWQVTAKPEFVGEPEVSIAAVTLEPGARPVLGAPRVATYDFAVTGAGSGEIVLEKHGPGAAGALLETFRVTITAQ